MDYATDKKLIKNGMTFLYRDKIYLKAGERCAVVTPTGERFEEIETAEIEMIFKPNGDAIIKKGE